MEKMGKNSEVEQYWLKKEQEIGEQIIHKSIAHAFYPASIKSIESKDRFGLLFLSGEHLYFEYSKKGKKSILESLFTRKGEGGLNELLKIPRNEIKYAKMLTLNTVRKWIRKSLSPDEMFKMVKGLEMGAHSKMRDSKVWALITGTCFFVITPELYISFDTPCNKEWEKLLD